MADLSQLATLGKDPVPGENPAGATVDLDAIRTEIQKLDSVTQEPVDWRQIIDQAEEILRSKSKHLLVANYLTLALLEEHGYAGLETGLNICCDLVATFWDTMEPPLKRKRGRIEAFVWLAERGGKASEDHKPKSDEKEALEACAASLKTLSAALAEKLAGDSPGLGDLQRNVNKYVTDFAAAARAAEAAEAAKKAQAARAATGEIGDLNTIDDARKALRKIQATAKQVCDSMRKLDPADPVAYRFIRSAIWGQIKELPPNTNGATQIPAPAPDLIARLNDLQQKSDWLNLVQVAEGAFTSAALWLDVQRWSALSLTALGLNHAAAAEAVIQETGGLVARLPGLINLSFAGGIPFVSNETKVWLTSEVQPRVGGMEQSRNAGLVADDNVPAGFAEVVSDARQLAARGKLAEAVKLYQDGIAATGQKRGQFLWRLGLARLCLDAGKVALAAPQLEELEKEIQQHELEVWEPRLCLEVYTALLTARRTLLKDTRRATPELAQKTSQLYDRLCRLNVMAAMSLDGK